MLMTDADVESDTGCLLVVKMLGNGLACAVLALTGACTSEAQCVQPMDGSRQLTTHFATALRCGTRVYLDTITLTPEEVRTEALLPLRSSDDARRYSLRAKAKC